jgi:hypothetical protein
MVPGGSADGAYLGDLWQFRWARTLRVCILRSIAVPLPIHVDLVRSRAPSRAPHCSRQHSRSYPHMKRMCDDSYSLRKYVNWSQGHCSGPRLHAPLTTQSVFASMHRVRVCAHHHPYPSHRLATGMQNSLEPPLAHLRTAHRRKRGSITEGQQRQTHPEVALFLLAEIMA